MIIFHGGSKSGFVPIAELIFKAGCATADYHSQMNYDHFEKRLREKLFPNILPESVICMDNTAHYSQSNEKRNLKCLHSTFQTFD